MASETFASFSCVSHAVADQNFFNILYAWPETRRLLYALPAEWNFAAQVTESVSSYYPSQQVQQLWLYNFGCTR